MSEELLIEVVHATIRTVAVMSAPIILAIAVVGLLSNVLQTISQIRDPALAFVPKVIVVGVLMAVLTPWFVQVLQQFTESMFALVAGAVQ